MFKTLIFTITLLLGQSGQDVFLIDLDQIKDTVDEKDSRRKLKKLAKSYVKSSKELDDLIAVQAEKFSASLANREVQSSTLRKQLSDFKSNRLPYLSELMDGRLKIQSIFTADEWAEYLKGFNMEPNYPEASVIRAELNNMERFKDLENSINESFSGAKYQKQAQDAFDRFTQSITEIVQNEADRQISTGAILSRQTATHNQLQKVLEDRFLFENALADALIHLRKKISEISEKDDWDEIAPKLSKLIL